jgi:hypothetical protein
MFVRKKTTKGGAVKHYLVECHREGGKVRQRVLCYLGDYATVEEALAGIAKEIKECRRYGFLWDKLPHLQEQAKRLRSICSAHRNS